MIKNTQNRLVLKKALLITMPWSYISQPAIGISTLKTCLENEGIGCDVYYGNMRILKHLKATTYSAVSDISAVNEFVFSYGIHGKTTAHQTKIMEEHAQLQKLKSVISIDTIIKIRDEIVPAYFEDIIKEIDFSQYALVGFTCSFNQTFASLGLANKIKEKWPDMLIAFGGTAFDETYGYKLQNTYKAIIDVISYGDGEPVIGPLYNAALGKTPLRDVPNISYIDENGRYIKNNKIIKIDLNTAPCPNYEDFFIDLRRLLKQYNIQITPSEIPIESSRGCWWKRCIFCGLHDRNENYRVKNPDKVLAEMETLNSKYNVKCFRFSDSIMPSSYDMEFIPKLIDKNESLKKKSYYISYETKSNLTRTTIEKYNKAGMVVMQPGIEHFISSVLKKMNKGVDGIQNIFTIYTLMRYNILCCYNILLSTPGETETECNQLASMIPSLYHLIPPMLVTTTKVTKYSELSKYINNLDQNNLINLHSAFKLLIKEEDLTSEDLTSEDLAIFLYDLEPKEEKLKHYNEVIKWQAQIWKEGFHKKAAFRLTFVSDNDGLKMTDTRFGKTDEYHLSKIYRNISDYMLNCDRPSNVSEIFANVMPAGFCEKEIEGALNDLCKKRILIKESNHLVWIAFKEEEYSPHAAGWTREALKDVTMNTEAKVML
jgi:ribosomal peptide maturation radical SAM protein 1